MGKTLKFEIDDVLYDLLAETAEQCGRQLEDVVVQFLADTAPRADSKRNKSQRKAALARLKRYAGVVNSGDPHGSDNDRIDADLAREYSSAHEEVA
jgi:hypothetical protein